MPPNQDPVIDRPLVTVDLAIFAMLGDTLQVLLVARPDSPGEPFPRRWALPGGFVDTRRDQDLEACALRKLREKTGIVAPYLEQVGSWGSAKRDPRGWSATHLYFALLSSGPSILKAGGNAADARWFPLGKTESIEPMAFDHSMLLQAALVRLRSKVEYTSLPAFLLPEEFTLAELQRVYETLLGRELQKKAFRTRVLATDLLTPTRRYREGANRPALLYRLRDGSAPVFFTRALAPG